MGAEGGLTRPLCEGNEKRPLAKLETPEGPSSTVVTYTTEDAPMMHKLLADARFYETLLEIDRDLARAVRDARCPCGGALHAGHYARKPRGGPPGLPASLSVVRTGAVSVVRTGGPSRSCMS